jgi:plastocyanin
MRFLSMIVALFASAIPVAAGDVAAQVVITRKLTKKTVAPVIYNLRGAVALTASPETMPVSEFEQTVVMLEGGKQHAMPMPITAIIEQRDTRFEPGLLVIPVGSTVQFPNFDPIFHNVFSLSSPQPFDLGFYAKTQSRSVKFTRAGIVQIYCHIHSHMYAAIVVTDSPFFGKPGSDGSFLFVNVPAGRYQLLAWHKVAGLHQVEIDVPETGQVNVKIRVPVDVGPQ